MNLVGKIFTVLIFVMSVVLMSLVMTLYATHTNWRLLVENPESNATPEHPAGYKYRLQNAEKQKEDLNSLLNEYQRNLERETIEKEQVRAKLETEKEELTRNLSAREEDLAAKTQSERDAVAQLKAVTASLNALKDENEKLRNDVKTIQQDRDTQFDQMVKRTEELHAKVNELDQLKRRNNDLISESANAMQLLRMLGYTNNPAYYLETANPPATLNAMVLSASQDLVVISCGADDGLRVGHTLEVTRGNTYVGSIEVREVTPDRAICKINKEKQQNSFQVKDRVVPKLK
ncbi:MAG: hypothetical protein IJF84_09975 [Thermoguttaceae bacterium]|nr:hypothetical protein [Thermoguttaceae bacterium]